MSIKDFSEAASLNSLIVGICLLITGVMLLLSRYIRGGGDKVTLKNGLIVGVIQGIAVMPGISRSGSTIIAGLASGLSKEEAFRFSFLLSIPAIIGATCVQALEFGGWGQLRLHAAGWMARRRGLLVRERPSVALPFETACHRLKVVVFRRLLPRGRRPVRNFDLHGRMVIWLS